MTDKHAWIKSTLGHGDSMCRRCGITNREAGVLGMLNDCEAEPSRHLPELEAVTVGDMWGPARKDCPTCKGTGWQSMGNGSAHGCVECYPQLMERRQSPTPEA